MLKTRLVATATALTLSLLTSAAIAGTTKAGYEAAKPWVKEKYEKSKKYLQDLWREHMDDKEPAPEPKKGEGKAI